jgi:hypothetical protein
MVITETVPHEVNWEVLMQEVEDRCGVDVANAIRHRLSILDRRVKNGTWRG